MPKFTPKDPKEFDQSNTFELLVPGDYDFEVFKAEDKQSASGNDMIKLELNVFDKDRFYKVWDYLTFSAKSLYKIHNFCKAVGMDKDYEKGELSAFSCIGKTGEVKIKVKKGIDQFEDKNIVGWYLISETKDKSSAPDKDEEIPF